MHRELERFCEEMLRELALLSLEKALGRPRCGLPVPKGTYKKVEERLFITAYNDRTVGNGFKLKEKQMDSPSLKMFTAGLDGALGNLI